MTNNLLGLITNTSLLPQDNLNQTAVTDGLLKGVVLFLNDTNQTCLQMKPPHSSVQYLVTALICTSIFVCTIVLVSSLVLNKDRKFLNWRFIDRVSLYTAACNLFFYMTQAPLLLLPPPSNGTEGVVDTRIFVSTFTILFMEFAFAEILMSTFIAICVLYLVFRNHSITFGRYDWQLHLPVLGIPLLILAVCETISLTKEEVSDCIVHEILEFTVYFFVIWIAFFFITTIYLVTWFQVARTSSSIRSTLHGQSTVKSNRLALKLSMYVFEFIFQFGGNATVGIWRLFDEPPPIIDNITLIFVVSGDFIPLFSMLEWINSLVDRLQPNYLRPEDLELLSEDGYVPTLSDLVIPSLVTASCLVVVRHVLDRVVVAPLGTYLGFKTKMTDGLTENPILEKEYSKCKTPSSDTIVILTKKCELTEREISKWFRKRRRNDKVTDIKKLQDASWHFMFYLIMSWYGVFILWDKPWFKKSINCFVDWPAQSVSNDVYWYYLIELGFYLSAVYMLFTDHKRKDFTELIIHHVVTIFLLVLSFSYNLLRAGTLVLCIHDQVDYLLAMAKIAIYCKKPMVADTLFVLFILVWIITRLGIYPYVILYTIFIDLPVYARELGPYVEMYDTCTIMKFVKGALLVLQILHLIWTWLIIKSAAAKFTAGEIQDARSDNEESEIEVDDKIEENGNCKTLDTEGLCQ
ncbi:unnamed protein product [Mytilus coruscus]|uniref:TLC domain-containing protein n=1 Tax=Mytilus coruscus TaxID=42192 RepID=A0A6J7ZWY7_MYTCO|nr:unnamed protein product [Mytilus coruscus]